MSVLKKSGKILLPVLSVLFWIIVWMIAAKAAGSSLILPGPGETIERLSLLAVSSEFWKTVGFSCLRILAGAVAGTILGAFLAAASYIASPVKHILSPLMTVARTVPVASFIVLCMLWINRALLPSFISFLMVFPIVYTSILSGLYEISAEHKKLIPAFELTPIKSMKYIYFPSVKPYFISSLRSSFGLSWKAGVAAEVLAFTPLSIGKMLAESKNYLETVDLFAWTLTVVLLSLLFESLIGLLSDDRRVQNHGNAEEAA